MYFRAVGRCKKATPIIFKANTQKIEIQPGNNAH